MKRINFLFLAVVLLLIVTACIAKINAAETSQSVENYLPELSAALGENYPESGIFSTENTSSKISNPLVSQPENPPTITAPKKASLFYNMTDNTLITSKNADKYIAPASLLKLLTASAALKYASPDTVITVGTELELVPSGSSLCLIAQGHSLTLYDLITGMLLSSGNDAAYTVAVSTARRLGGNDLGDREAVEYFANLMNNFARELGMENSYFVNPDGSDDKRQFTTANDLLLLARYAMTVPEIREIAGIHQKYVVFASGHNITWTNTNKLLDPESEFYSPNAVGLKTGTTDLAGCNLIAAFNKNGKLYIAVAAGCKNDKERYSLVTEYLSKV